MLIAPTPDSETERLQALRRYQVLDTPAEAAFDRLTRLAAHLLAVPTALVSLVDADRQWFKSRIGMAACETSRDVSFCSHAVYARSLLVVPDATLDPRFADNPMVTDEPGVRFYVGAPLIGSDGHVLGTLCGIDHVPRPAPGAEQLQLLQMLAATVVDALELRLHASRQDDTIALSQLCSEVAALAHRASTLKAALPDVLAALCTYAGASQGQCWLIDGTAETLTGPGACGWQAPTPGALPAMPDSDPPAQALAAPGPVLVHALQAQDGPQSAAWHAAGLRAALCLAVRADGSAQALLACAGAELRRRDEDLHAAAGFVAAQLQCLAERARAVAIQDEFVATVSHELRTPLTSIAGMLELMELGQGGSLDPKARHMIGVAHRNSLRLTRLVNDILEIGKLEAGALELELQAQTLAPLVERAIDENLSLAGKRQVQLVFSNLAGAVQGLVDGDRTIQVVTNLLSNAVKFSPPGGTVMLTLQQLESGLRLSVADQGPGIPEAFQPRIFGRFAQAAACFQQQQGGSGLGLAIVRHLVRAMGGSVGFRSVAEHGTVFHVDLPLVQTAQSDGHAMPAAGPQAADDPGVAGYQTSDSVVFSEFTPRPVPPSARA